jgi:hypothetical protein
MRIRAVVLAALLLLGLGGTAGAQIVVYPAQSSAGGNCTALAGAIGGTCAATVFNYPLTIAPAAGTRAINVTQSDSTAYGGSGGYHYSDWTIADNKAVNASFGTFGIVWNMITGGANENGQVTAFYVALTHNTASTTLHDQTAISAAAVYSASDDSNVGHLSGPYGLNASGSVTNGATVGVVAGLEADSAVCSTCAATFRWSVLAANYDTGHASTLDTAFAITGITGGAFTDGLTISNIYGAASPISGSLFRTQGDQAQTITNIMQFPNETVTGAIFNFVHFVVDGPTGAVTTGVWHGTTVAGTYGGTGVNNGASTITVGGSLSTGGALTVADLPTANQLLYVTSARNLGGLATANSGVLVTSGAGVPSISTTLPSGLSATNLTLVTPALGTPASGVATNLTGTAASLTAGTVTTNANLTGVITSSGNVTVIASQTGTGSKFVVDTGPTIVNPTLKGATDGSITIGLHGSLCMAGNCDGIDGLGNINFHSGAIFNAGNQVLSFSGANAVFAASASAVSLAVSGSSVTMPGLGTSSAATTGTLCWTTGTGLVNVDTTLACLASDERLKEISGPISGALAEVMALSPIVYTWKDGPKQASDPGEHFGLGAFATAYVDERLIARDLDGNPRGWRQDAVIATLVAAIQEQQAEISTLRATRKP